MGVKFFFHYVILNLGLFDPLLVSSNICKQKYLSDVLNLTQEIKQKWLIKKNISQHEKWHGYICYWVTCSSPEKK